eukprot:scaffold71317_cov31-Tisochrysis_lutea.AAC.1
MLTEPCAVTGGAPADLDGPITLCGRSDLSLERFFTGQLSNLMLFDTALTEDEVGNEILRMPGQAVCIKEGFPTSRLASDSPPRLTGLE